METINLEDSIARAHCKAIKLQPPGSDSLTIWGVYLPFDDMQKRERLYKLVEHNLKVETDKASKDSCKDRMHQEFAGAMTPESIDCSASPHRQYTSRHRTDPSQDSRIDDKLISRGLCQPARPTSNILHSCGDSDHDPMLAKIPLTSIKFVKPGPEPPPLPREARLKTPVPQADLDAFKQELKQETAIETACLNKAQDETLNPAYLIEEAMEPAQHQVSPCGAPHRFRHHRTLCDGPV